MAATAGEHVIRVPDATTVEEHRLKRNWATAALKLAFALFCIILAVVGLVLGFVHLISWLDQPPAEYTASIAAIDGGAAAPPPRSVFVAGGNGSSLAVPALFNLTVRITNPDRSSSACLGNTAASVVYNGTTIADGALPWFCAGKRGQREVVVPMWGVVVVDAPLTWLPSPGEMQRAGAVVDVTVWTVRYYSRTPMGCRGLKVGGGWSRCSF